MGLCTLQVTPSKFIHNDGRSVALLQLSGTIPVWYRSTRYNIPITIWLLEAFPRVAPLVYVTPTKEMVIQVTSHVDASGLVSVPYLREWVFQGSSLLKLAQILCDVFGQQPPVYSLSIQPQAWQPFLPQMQQPQQVGQVHGTRDSTISPYGTAASGAPRGVKTQDFAPSATPHTLPLEQQGSSTTSSYSGHTAPLSASSSQGSGRDPHGLGLRTGDSTGAGLAGSPGVGPTKMGFQGLQSSHGPSVVSGSAAPAVAVDVVEVFRRNAVPALAARLARDVEKARQESSHRLDCMEGVQSLLESRRSHLDEAVQQLRAEKAALEQNLQVSCQCHGVFVSVRHCKL